MRIYVVLQNGQPHSAYASQTGAIDCQKSLGEPRAEVVATDLYGLSSSDVASGDWGSGYLGRRR